MTKSHGALHIALCLRVGQGQAGYAAADGCFGYGAGYGFDGVAMALIGQLHPIATMVVALFFAVLRVGSTTMQAATGVPTSVSDIIQALVIVFSVAGMALTKLPEFQAWRSRVFHGRKAGEA